VTSACINVSEAACNLSVIVDSQLTLSAQVAAVCRSGYYQLRQLRPLVRSMSSDAVKTLVQAFILCRLDYCNSMFYGITDGLMSRPQSVQNAGARLVSGARRYDHITPVLQELHWLPVRRRVDFKMVVLVYLSLSGMASPYLVADCQLVSDEGRRQLHSANSRTCSSYGDRCFAAAGPRLWNSLPAHLRQTDINFEQFKLQLKTFFWALRVQHIVAIVKLHLLNNLTYLLSC